MKPAISLFWFRRDLRLEDNHGLYNALRSGLPVLPLFIFDTTILADLPRKDARVEFIHGQVLRLHATLVALGSGMKILYGNPVDIFPALMREYNLKAVYTNEDYEPAAIARDQAIGELLRKKGIDFHLCHDQVIFHKDEIIPASSPFYSVYTPYSKKWKDSLISTVHLRNYDTASHYNSFLNYSAAEPPSLKKLGFEPAGIPFPPVSPPVEVLRKYDQQRDIPSIEGTSRLSVHLRFGTVSIRRLVELARKTNEVWLNELIWREFFMQILWHNPRVVKEAFKPQYDKIRWRNNEKEFEKWCNGMTGYPIVDAGMRELVQTGHMHNRVRMITASFLVKHLLVDWRRGEAFFAQHLLDFELASNNGNWQWAAGCGCDAAPYFRIFNPTSQQEKFDPQFKYILKWVPEYGTPAYPRPLVDHKMARERCLETYSVALKDK